MLNLFVFCGSTAFLIGPAEQLRKMFDPVRVYATAVYLGFVVLALVCAILVGPLFYPVNYNCSSLLFGYPECILWPAKCNLYGFTLSAFPTFWQVLRFSFSGNKLRCLRMTGI